MLGWEEQVAAVAAAVNSLPVEQRARVMLIARNYGEAGALEFYGPRQGLLQPILLPKNEQLWPLPAREPCEIAVTIGISTNDLHEFFNTVRLFGHFDHPWMGAGGTQRARLHSGESTTRPRRGVAAARAINDPVGSPPSRDAVAGVVAARRLGTVRARFPRAGWCVLEHYSQ